MGTQSVAQKRGPVFNTDFTIPKKKCIKAECTNVDNKQSTSQFEQAQILTVNETILPFLATEQRKELPKTNADKRGRDKYVLNDPTLPPQLTVQFQPLFCKLCECQHSSNVMAKLHYDSKKHEKKVRKFLVEHAEKTGSALHPRAIAVKRNDTDPKYFYCDSCEIPLTGRLHAESHYMSKNHRRVIVGAAKPSGRERTDCFGLDFVKQNLRCQLCNVSVTSEQQMTVHTNGSRHKKKVRLLELENGCNSIDDTILSSLGTSVPKTDLSVFRTPTGFYYCNPCNITLNSEAQFKQHLDSKRHKKKAVGSA